MVGFRHLVAVGVHELERLGEDEALALLDTAREMQVHLHVAVNIIKEASVRRIHRESTLPGIAPVSEVLSRKRVRRTLQTNEHLVDLVAVRGAGEVYRAIRRAKDAGIRLREQLP